MKISALVVLGSALILTSCGKKGDDKKSESSNSSPNDTRDILKSGSLVNNIDLYKKIRGTSWILTKIVDHENKEVADAKITELSFDNNNDVLNIKNSNSNVNMCSIKNGGKYVIVKSTEANEYLIQDFDYNCSSISAGGKIIPSMAIIKMNQDNSISISRHSLKNFSASNGKINPSVIQTEAYTKK